MAVLDVFKLGIPDKKIDTVFERFCEEVCEHNGRPLDKLTENEKVFLKNRFKDKTKPNKITI